MVVSGYNSRMQSGEAGGLRVPGQPELNWKTLYTMPPLPTADTQGRS